MDQSFSPQNLREVWDIHTRKGQDLLRYFSTPEKRYREYRDIRDLSRRARSDWLLRPFDSGALDALAADLKSKADNALADALAATSQRLIHAVETRQFSWGLALGGTHNGRQTYQLAKSAEVFFADKQLQRSIASASPGRTPSRSATVGALMRVLDNRLPKAVVRIDVDRFYENVDHERLRAQLRMSALTPTSIGLVSLLLDEYESLTGTARGLPTGVGLSAKLSELYIGPVDRAIASIDDVLFSARYVDDILVVVGEAATPKKSDAELLREVTAAVANLGLGVNNSKSLVRRMTNDRIQPFDFLGYSLSFAGSVKANLTDSRQQAIKRRLNLTLDAWDRSDPSNHGRRKLLLDRLRLLTGNTRLTHNKRNAMVGIYFSNPHLTEIGSLRSLDAYMSYRLSRSRFPIEFEPKLLELSFVEGFGKRRMHRFSTTQLKKMRGVWR